MRRGKTGQIVERLVSELGQVDGEPVPLDGGITNRNFRARFGGRDYVIRVPGKDTGLLGIDRQAERLANQCAAEIGIAPPVAAFLTDPPCIVTEFVEGESLSSEQLRTSPRLERVASALRSLHDLEQSLSSRFDSVRIVEDYAQVASERGAEVPGEYVPALDRAREVGAALRGAEHTPVPCHNDLLAANFIEGEDRTWIVDWEYAGMGDRYFDLANFSVNNGLDGEQEEALLDLYFGAADIGDLDPGQPARRLAALRLMCFMSDFREAMWGVVQSAVSEIEFDFDGYAADHFERLGKRADDPDFDRWLEVAGGA